MAEISERQRNRAKEMHARVLALPRLARFREAVRNFRKVGCYNGRDLMLCRAQRWGQYFFTKRRGIRLALMFFFAASSQIA